MALLRNKLVIRPVNVSKKLSRFYQTAHFAQEFGPNEKTESLLDS